MFNLKRCRRLGVRATETVCEHVRHSFNRRGMATHPGSVNLDPWTGARSLYSRNISTFDPERMTAADFIQLHGHYSDIYDRHYLKWNPQTRTWGRLVGSVDKPISTTIRYLTPSTKTGVNARRRKGDTEANVKAESESEAESVRDTKWPPGSRGFLYFWHRPDLSLKTAQIRFRVVPEGDLRRFKLGHDLLFPWGLPWNLPMPYACKPNYRMIAEALVRDGLLTEELVKELEGDLKNVNLRNNVVYSMYQPFYVNFAGAMMKMSIIGGGPPLTMAMRAFLLERRGAHALEVPWGGKAICRLEPSTLPEDAGQDVVHMRVLKIVEPVKCLIAHYDRHIEMPAEGELIKRGGKPQAASFTNNADLDAIRLFMATADTAPKEDVTFISPSSESTSK